MNQPSQWNLPKKATDIETSYKEAEANYETLFIAANNGSVKAAAKIVELSDRINNFKTPDTALAPLVKELKHYDNLSKMVNNYISELAAEFANFWESANIIYENLITLSRNVSEDPALFSLAKDTANRIRAFNKTVIDVSLEVGDFTRKGTLRLGDRVIDLNELTVTNTSSISDILKRTKQLINKQRYEDYMKVLDKLSISSGSTPKFAFAYPTGIKSVVGASKSARAALPNAAFPNNTPFISTRGFEANVGSQTAQSQQSPTDVTTEPQQQVAAPTSDVNMIDAYNSISTLNDTTEIKNVQLSSGVTRDAVRQRTEQLTKFMASMENMVNNVYSSKQPNSVTAPTFDNFGVVRYRQFIIYMNVLKKNFIEPLRATVFPLEVAAQYLSNLEFSVDQSTRFEPSTVVTTDDRVWQCLDMASKQLMNLYRVDVIDLQNQIADFEANEGYFDSNVYTSFVERIKTYQDVLKRKRQKYYQVFMMLFRVMVLVNSRLQITDNTRTTNPIEAASIRTKMDATIMSKLNSEQRAFYTSFREMNSEASIPTLFSQIIQMENLPALTRETIAVTLMLIMAALELNAGEELAMPEIFTDPVKRAKRL